MLSFGFVQAKPGTGKTTSAVWLAAALHERGLDVVLADTDPTASAMRWSDLAGGVPWRMVGLASNDFHRQIGRAAAGADAVVVDAPQLEDHAGIARSVMRWVKETVVPVAPAGVELDRMAPVRKEVDDLTPMLADDASWCVLLNRTVTNAASTKDARETLTGLGDDVLTTTIGRRELYAGSFGALPTARGTDYDALATELLARQAA